MLSKTYGDAMRGGVFGWGSHVIESRVGNEEGSVQQFPNHRRIYMKYQLIQLSFTFPSSPQTCREDVTIL